MEPYYDHKGITIYHGDCLKVMPSIARKDAVITDPPYNVGKDYGVYKDNLTEENYKLWMLKVIEQCLEIAPRQFWISPRFKNGFFINALPLSHEVVIKRDANGPPRGGGGSASLKRR